MFKRVTYPLDDMAKARIVGPDYVSSGSEHSAEADDDVTSSSLSELFYGFSVDEDPPPEDRCDSDCDLDPSICDSISVNFDLIESIVRNRSDDFRNVLEAHVRKAVQVFSFVRASERQTVRRNVMAYLRNCGYDAAVCKTKWRSCGGLAAGEHEFIDVVAAADAARYVVDLDFAAGFEIARPESSYARLASRLPAIFVGAVGDLRVILKVVSDAARRSLKSGGLHLPPWRKHRYVQNKWLGPYKRTANVFPATTGKQSYGVKCRAVGFDAAVNGGRLMFPATARTR